MQKLLFLVMVCLISNSAFAVSNINASDYEDFNNTLSGQKSITNKEFDEVVDALEKKKKAKEEKAQKNAIKAQPKYKSLHYIDEDDYEELPEIKTSNQGKKPMGGSGDRPEIKD